MEDGGGGVVSADVGEEGVDGVCDGLGAEFVDDKNIFWCAVFIEGGEKTSLSGISSIKGSAEVVGREAKTEHGDGG